MDKVIENWGYKGGKFTCYGDSFPLCPHVYNHEMVDKTP